MYRFNTALAQHISILVEVGFSRVGPNPFIGKFPPVCLFQPVRLFRDYFTTGQDSFFGQCIMGAKVSLE